MQNYRLQPFRYCFFLSKKIHILKKNVIIVFGDDGDVHFPLKMHVKFKCNFFFNVLRLKFCKCF